jgi:hypothetical protein
MPQIINLIRKLVVFITLNKNYIFNNKFIQSEIVIYYFPITIFLVKLLFNT